MNNSGPIGLSHPFRVWAEDEGGGGATAFLAPDPDIDNDPIDEIDSDSHPGNEVDEIDPFIEVDGDGDVSTEATLEALEAIAAVQGVSVEEVIGKLIAPDPTPETYVGPTESPRHEAARRLREAGYSEHDDQWFELLDELTWGVFQEKQELASFAREAHESVPIYESQLEQMSLPREIAPRFAQTLASFGPSAKYDAAQQTMALDMAIGYHIRTQLASGRNPLDGLSEVSPRRPAPTTGGGYGQGPVRSLSREDQQYVVQWQQRYNGGKPPNAQQLKKLRADGEIS